MRQRATLLLLIPLLLTPMLLVPIVLTVPGCAVAAWMAAAFTPPKPIPALYQLPRNCTVLVLVNDPNGLTTDVYVRRELTDELNGLLVEHDVAAKTIDVRRIMQTASVTPNFYRMSPEQIGRLLEATHVVTIDITDFQLKDDPIGHIWKGRITADVNVYDAQEGLLWPTDRANGYPVEPVTTPTTENQSADYAQTLANKLSRQLADHVAKLFYEHEGRAPHELPPAEEERMPE